ncbi:MAG TPA: dTDP-4-dehydrorhamnose 3,5-epimerase [candidate division Zixibacteria bacterium]|nr:dTDP-4-dehydrorhamnose 3,5-epimerase [candidate division Zixibacteria bacterium]
MDGVDPKIEGVSVKKLQVHPDSRGRLFEILRRDDPIFKRFGQAYLTSAYPGVVKAWHYHKIQTDYFSCLHGAARLVLYDPREGSSTRGNILEFLLGPENLLLVTIPPEVYHGFQCISETEALMLNIPTEPYNQERPDEYRIDESSKDIPYTWPKIKKEEEF